MSAGKGDTPRPVDAKVYGENYDSIFRKDKPVSDRNEVWPNDPNPFESPDHDNDSKIYS